MKLIRNLLFCAFSLSIALTFAMLHGQTAKPVKWAYQGQNGPITIPTTAAAICTYRQGQACSTTQTIYVTELSLYSPSATPDTCWVIDSAGNPLYGTAAHPETVSGRQIQTYADYPMAGITWGCTNGTTTGYIAYHLPQ